MGRNTVITPKVELELTQYIIDGASNAEACRLANISEDTFYRKTKSDTDFADKMETAKNSTILQAKRVLRKAIEDGDKQVAGWYLERKKKDEFAQRTELTGSEGHPLGYLYSSDLKKIEGTDVLELKEGNQQ